MLLEVKGADHWNKGSELMLRCILQEVGSWAPSPGVVISPRKGPYLWRARLGLYQKLSPARLLKPGWPDVAAAIPRWIRTEYGLVADRDIDAILDASGFAYGAQWGPGSAVRLATASRQWRRSGKRAVLLPQALGPFEGTEMRDAFRRAVDSVDLVYARDERSYASVLETGAPAEKVRKAPDFTIAMKGVAPADLDLGPRPVAIVPNTKVIEKGGAAEHEYVALMKRCVQALTELGCSAFLLAHDSGGDLALANQLAGSMPVPLRVVHREDPVELKGVIGACHLLIGSRYHALVAALTQEVPGLAIGWSHKYGALLEDYGSPELTISVEATVADVRAALEPLLEGATREAVLQRLRATNERYRAETTGMWAEVRSVLQDSARDAA